MIILAMLVFYVWLIIRQHRTARKEKIFYARPRIGTHSHMAPHDWVSVGSGGFLSGDGYPDSELIAIYDPIVASARANPNQWIKFNKPYEDRKILWDGRFFHIAEC